MKTVTGGGQLRDTSDATDNDGVLAAGAASGNGSSEAYGFMLV